MEIQPHKVQVNLSLDYELMQAFDKFCPYGERSSTLQELIKDYLVKKGRFGNQKEGLKTEKDLLSKRMQEIQTKEDEIDFASRQLLAQREAQVQAQARAMQSEQVKSNRMFRARQAVLVSFGLPSDTPVTELPEDVKMVFGARMREFYARLEKEDLERES